MSGRSNTVKTIHRRYEACAGFVTTPRCFDDSPQQFLQVAPPGTGVIQRVNHIPDYAYEPGEPGERHEVSWYDGGSWHESLRNSTGLTAQPRQYIDISEAPDRVKEIYDIVYPHYDAMHRHRLKSLAVPG